jgi:hypothetical protein
MNLFWLEADSQDNGGDVLSPEVLAQEIVENLRDTLAQFETVAE